MTVSTQMMTDEQRKKFGPSISLTPEGVSLGHDVLGGGGSMRLSPRYFLGR